MRISFVRVNIVKNNQCKAEFNSNFKILVEDFALSNYAYPDPQTNLTQVINKNTKPPI